MLNYSKFINEGRKPKEPYVDWHSFWNNAFFKEHRRDLEFYKENLDKCKSAGYHISQIFHWLCVDEKEEKEDPSRPWIGKQWLGGDNIELLKYLYESAGPAKLKFLRDLTENSIPNLKFKNFKYFVDQLGSGIEQFISPKSSYNFAEIVSHKQDNIKKLAYLKTKGLDLNYKDGLFLRVAASEDDEKLFNYLVRNGLDPKKLRDGRWGVKKYGVLDEATDENCLNMIKKLVALGVIVTPRHMYNVIKNDKPNREECFWALYSSTNKKDDYGYNSDQHESPIGMTQVITRAIDNGFFDIISELCKDNKNLINSVSEVTKKTYNYQKFIIGSKLTDKEKLEILKHIQSKFGLDSRIEKEYAKLLRMDRFDL